MPRALDVVDFSLSKKKKQCLRFFLRLYTNIDHKFYIPRFIIELYTVFFRPAEPASDSLFYAHMEQR